MATVGGSWAAYASRSGPRLYPRIADGKVAKNRVHLDSQPPSGARDEAVDRLLALGATLHEDHRRPTDGMGWVTMRDIEGNEFCVERSAVERGLASG